jgi:hypothetical protein
MLLKFLYFILLLAAFRFAVRLVRTVLAVSGSRPEVRSKRAPASGLDKETIIDVEFTEEVRPDPDRNKAP